MELGADALSKGIRCRPGIDAHGDHLRIVLVELCLGFDEAL
jgi:hypothetical protein